MRDVHAGGGPACFAKRVLTPGLRSRTPRRGRGSRTPAGGARQGEELARDPHHGATCCRKPRWCQSFPRRCRPFAHSLGDGLLSDPGLPGPRGQFSSSRPPEDQAGLDRGGHDVGRGNCPAPSRASEGRSRPALLSPGRFAMASPPPGAPVPTRFPLSSLAGAHVGGALRPPGHGCSSARHSVRSRPRPDPTAGAACPDRHPGIALPSLLALC